MGVIDLSAHYTAAQTDAVGFDEVQKGIDKLLASAALTREWQPLEIMGFVAIFSRVSTDDIIHHLTHLLFRPLRVSAKEFAFSVSWASNCA